MTFKLVYIISKKLTEKLNIEILAENVNLLDMLFSNTLFYIM